MTSLRVIAAATLSLLGIAHGAPAWAQPPNGGIASATVSAATNIVDGTSVSIAGAMGYRFNPLVALGVEFMFVPSLSADIPDIPIPLGLGGQFGGVSYPSPAIRIGDDGGHATIFTTHLRLTIPTRSRRISPYLIGGAGVGAVTDTFQYTITYPPITFTGLTGLGGATVIYPSLLPRSEFISRTTTDFTATFGGGVSFLAGDHVSFDVDARYFGIFGRRDAQIGRFGGGITYRF